jgi:hypothetical protein
MWLAVAATWPLILQHSVVRFRWHDDCCQMLGPLSATLAFEDTNKRSLAQGESNMEEL